jgi:copper(I)-binding protein
VGVGLVLVLTGCGAGQLTQTAKQVAAVNGASATVGGIAIRDAQFAYPASKPARYEAGAAVPLLVTIANSGLEADELVSVEGDLGAATITGSKTILGGFALVATTTPAPATGAATSAAAGTTTPDAHAPATPTTAAPALTTTAVPAGAPKPGEIQIVFPKISGPVVPGKTVKLRFVFAKAGAVDVAVPLANPEEAPSAGH